MATVVDALDRVSQISARTGPAPGTVLYQADYTYWPNRDLVHIITYGNGTSITYDYDAADRVKLIEHRITSQPAFLKLAVYDYDGRVQDITVSDDLTQATVFFTSYVYHSGRDLVRFAYYGNGMVVEYDYDDADRLILIKHGATGQNPILDLDYTNDDGSSAYDGRGLLTRVVETNESLQQSIIVYDYDTPGRLIEESRVGTHPYHFKYNYDHGDNRTCKVDVGSGNCTIYHYDLEDPQAYGHKANRLMSYEIRQFSAGETECPCTCERRMKFVARGGRKPLSLSKMSSGALSAFKPPE